jgi:hypothetical protein
MQSNWCLWRGFLLVSYSAGQIRRRLVRTLLSGLITGLFTLTLAHELKIRFGVEWRTVIDELMLSVCAVILNVQTHRSPRDERNDQQRGNSSFMVLSRAFTPVLAKHSNSFSLIECVSIGVDRMQRNVEPM